MLTLREDTIKLIFDSYSTEPEFPWEDAPDACIFRHYDNRKWFAIIMSVKKATLGLSGDGRVDVMNVKIAPEDLYDLLHSEGILPAYHMNKKHWVSVLLDGSVNVQALAKLLEVSYRLTQKKVRCVNA